jgi:ribosomal protein S25
VGWQGQVKRQGELKRISEKLKVNGSLARKAIRELFAKGLIKDILIHKQQSIYTRATNV